MEYLARSEETAVNAREHTSRIRVSQRQEHGEKHDITFSVRAVIHRTQSEANGVFARRDALMGFELGLVQRLNMSHISPVNISTKKQRARAYVPDLGYTVQWL